MAMTEEIIDWTTEYPTIEWCGHNWRMDAEGGRKIHPDSPYEYYHPDCVKMCGDDISLTVIDRPCKVKHWNDVIYDSKYARGMIRSAEPFTYGTFVLECVLPKGNMLHSSFWLTNENTWPPEIDVFEAYTNSVGCYLRWPAKASKRTLLPVYAVESNMHYSDGDGNHRQTFADRCVVGKLGRPASRTCEYRLEWTAGSVTISYDGSVVRRVSDDEYPELFEDLNRHPYMFVYINTGLREDRFNGVKREMVVRSFSYLAENSQNR